jgi:hypothetical protein
VLGRLPRSRGRLFADTTPLRTPDFRRLWLAGIVTVIGGNLTIFAVPVQLYALTQNSAYVGLSGLFAVAAAGGGVLVVVGVVIATLVVPAFVRYRVAEGDKV